MKLYQYDHCPFCVRADMMAHYKEVSFEPVYLLNDDNQTCIDLIGTKMVPILEQDGKAMGESLDIAKRLDEIGASDKVVLAGGNAEPYTSILGSVMMTALNLLFPRSIALGLPEFATESAVEFYTKNKEAVIEKSFSQALSETAEHIVVIEAAFNQLPQLKLPSEQGNQISWDDVLIYPTLRNLSMVKGLKFPPQVRAYVEEVAKVTGTHTYFDRAI